VGPSAGLDAVVKRKIPSPSRDSNPRSSSPQRYTTELSWLLNKRISVNIIVIINKQIIDLWESFHIQIHINVLISPTAQRDSRFGGGGISPNQRVEICVSPI
jgi:hypothetical protein